MFAEGGMGLLVWGVLEWRAEEEVLLGAKMMSPGQGSHKLWPQLNHGNLLSPGLPHQHPHLHPHPENRNHSGHSMSGSRHRASGDWGLALIKLGIQITSLGQGLGKLHFHLGAAFSAFAAFHFESHWLDGMGWVGFGFRCAGGLRILVGAVCCVGVSQLSLLNNLLTHQSVARTEQ